MLRRTQATCSRLLAQAGQVTGEVLHVDGGSHAGRW
jgi:hypothetical protein